MIIAVVYQQVGEPCLRGGLSPGIGESYNGEYWWDRITHCLDWKQVSGGREIRMFVLFMSFDQAHSWQQDVDKVRGATSKTGLLQIGCVVVVAGVGQCVVLLPFIFFFSV